MLKDVFVGFLTENNEQHVLPDFSSTTLHLLLFGYRMQQSISRQATLACAH